MEQFSNSKLVTLPLSTAHQQAAVLVSQLPGPPLCQPYHPPFDPPPVPRQEQTVYEQPEHQRQGNGVSSQAIVGKGHRGRSAKPQVDGEKGADEDTERFISKEEHNRVLKETEVRVRAQEREVRMPRSQSFDSIVGLEIVFSNSSLKPSLHFECFFFPTQSANKMNFLDKRHRVPYPLRGVGRVRSQPPRATGILRGARSRI